MTTIKERKKGKKNNLGLSIKYIKGAYYMYETPLNEEKTREKREELERQYRENPLTFGMNPETIEAKSKVYDWKSQGQIDFVNPKDKFKAFIARNTHRIYEVIKFTENEIKRQEERRGK